MKSHYGPLFEFLTELAQVIGERHKQRGTLTLPGISAKTAGAILNRKRNYVEHPTLTKLATSLKVGLEAGWPELKRKAVVDLFADWGLNLRQQPPQAEKLLKFLERLAIGEPNGRTFGFLPDDAFGSQVFGRSGEIEVLHEIWHDKGIRIAWIEADGGAGKTSLVLKWLFELTKFRTGKPRICWFSFNDAGNDGSSASSATFFTMALRDWFGQADLPREPVEHKVDRLVRALAEADTILVLDGIESLQHEEGHSRCGFIADQALRKLVEELAALGKAKRMLCVLTTRRRIRNLEFFRDDNRPQVKQIQLRTLDQNDARWILESYSLQGSNNFPAIVTALRSHPLALHLLASYLAARYDHNAKYWEECLGLGWQTSDDPQGHADRILDYYGKWLESQPAKVQLLRLVSLFLDGASRNRIDALLLCPPVRDLTDALVKLSRLDRNALVSSLVESHLLATNDERHWTHLGVHPIIHEHFRSTLPVRHKSAWRLGNQLLAKELKRTICIPIGSQKEAQNLMASVVHQCRGGDYAGAYHLYLDQVHLGGTKGGTKGFSTWGQDLTREFGLWGDDLRALLAFTKNNDWAQPASALSHRRACFVQVQIGIRYRWLGRLTDCSEVMDHLLTKLEPMKQWRLLGQPIRFLSECHLLMGELEKGAEEAERGVAFAKAAIDSTRKPNRDVLDDLNLAQVGVHTILAHAYHQLGRLREAEALFKRSEQLQEPRFGECLLSVRGFRYCQLLLDQEQYSQARDYASEMLRDAAEPRPWNLGRLEVGLSHVLLGAVAGFDGNSLAANTYFQEGIAALEAFHSVEYLLIGHLLHARFLLDQKDYNSVRATLKMTAAEAEHSEMPRLAVDGQLLHTRLLQKTGKWKEAQILFDTTKQQIERMHYFRHENNLRFLARNFDSS